MNIEDVVALATHCLSLFIQLNWTGPPEASIRDEIVGQVGEEQWRQLNQDTVEKLRVDEVVSCVVASQHTHSDIYHQLDIMVCFISLY